MATRAHRFPAGFLFGAATAAHQVEGDNRRNDWWEAEQAGLLPFRSGDCCHHYDRFEADFDLLQSWCHNCHRFSIEWSRIEPREGEWDSIAVEHYRDVIRALRTRRLEPIVTLHHFSNPAWFAHRGGWLRRDAAALFDRYVRRVVEELGREITYWITINEPTVYVMQAYINGVWPPFQRGRPWHAARALGAFASAHRRAYATIKAGVPSARVGFAHSALLVEPCDPRRLRDRWTARLRDFALNGLFVRLLGASTEKRKSAGKTLDFIGINYYTRCCVTAGGSGASLLFGRTCPLEHHQHQGAKSSIGWELYPRGLGIMLSRFARFGVPLFVTENGVATEDDRVRCRFLGEHLGQVAQALHDGIEVLGYLHWTLVDNFEWHLGTGPKFGLAAIDPQTGERIARPSAELFATICRDDASRRDGQ